MIPERLERRTRAIGRIAPSVVLLVLAVATGCATGPSPDTGDDDQQVLEGTLRGVRCVTAGELCAEGPGDPNLRLQSDLVLTQPDGSFYYLFGVDRATKLHFALQKVRVVGLIDPKYRTIAARRLEVLRDGRWEVAWKPGRPYDPRRQPGATRL
jgi:hypothetical protein